MVVGSVEDTGQRLLTVEKMRVGNLDRFLARFLDFADAKLNERLLFPLETFRVGTDVRALDRVRKEQGVAAGALGTGRASACGRKQVRVVRVEGGVGQAQVDFALDPVPQLAHDDKARVLVFENRGGGAMPRKTLA